MCSAKVHGVVWVCGGVIAIGNSLWLGMPGNGKAAFTFAIEVSHVAYKIPWWWGREST